MKNQKNLHKNFKNIFFIVFYSTLISNAFSNVNRIEHSEYESPNIAVFEMQLQENEALLFGKVDSVEQKKSNQERNELKGFKYFKVVLKVDQVWSKNQIQPLETYTFEFGTMVDEQHLMNSLPVKKNEKLAVVLDKYKPKGLHTLKDHLLNIYEQHTDKVTGREFFVSKLTKHYSQKNLVLNELQRVAFTEKMTVYDFSGKGDVYQGPVTAERSIASVSNDFEDSLQEESAPITIKRDPSSNFQHKNDDLSVFGLLMILVFLGIFSHFVVKYYEDQEEEI